MIGPTVFNIYLGFCVGTGIILSALVVFFVIVPAVMWTSQKISDRRWERRHHATNKSRDTLTERPDHRAD